VRVPRKGRDDSFDVYDVRPISSRTVDDQPSAQVSQNPQLNHPFRGFRFGSQPIGCAALQPAIDNLGAAIQAANAAGLNTSNSGDYAAAAQFYSQQTSWLSETWFSGSTECQNLVTQANQLYTALNTAVTAAGGSAPTAPPAPVPTPGDIFSTLGIPSWVLPVTFGVIGLVGLAWLASSVAKIWPRRKQLT
jgi:hypothetical protein